jgi:hypothetical protein
MALEIQVLPWDRHTNMAGLDLSVNGIHPILPLLIIVSPTETQLQTSKNSLNKFTFTANRPLH